MHLRERKVKAKELGKIISISMNDSINDFTILKPQGKGGTKRRQDLPDSFSLEEWAIVPCSHYCGLYLEGHRRGDPESVSWMTSMIEKRLDSRRLITVSGQCYQLLGNMFDDGCESALSQEFLTFFQRGFPRNWKTLLLEEGQRHKVTQTNGPVTDVLENVDTFSTHACRPSFDAQPIVRCKQPAVSQKAVSGQNKTPKSLKEKDPPTKIHTHGNKPKSQTRTPKLAKTTLAVPSPVEDEQSKTASKHKNTPRTSSSETKANIKRNSSSRKTKNNGRMAEISPPKLQKSRARANDEGEEQETSRSLSIQENDVNISNRSTRSKNTRKKAQGSKASPAVNKNSSQTSNPKVSLKSRAAKSPAAKSNVLKSIQNSQVPPSGSGQNSNHAPPPEKEKPSKPWTKKEVNLLQRIMQDIDKTTPGFWPEVSEKMGTRSEEECQQFYCHDEEKQTKKKPVEKSKENTGLQAKPTTQITAAKGTMKRKKQLKEYMENFNAGYEDEYFDSTPFKARKPLKIPKLDMDSSFKMIADELGGWKSPGVSLISTPGLKYSGMPTPTVQEESAITPRLGDADKYVHKVLKQRKGRRITRGRDDNLKTLKEIPENPLPDPVGPLFEKNTVNPENHMDSDEEFDDYFTN